MFSQRKFAYLYSNRMQRGAPCVTEKDTTKYHDNEKSQKGPAQKRGHAIQLQNPAGQERQAKTVKMLKRKTTKQECHTWKNYALEVKKRDDSPRQMNAEGVH